ncbi:MAG: glycosyltransferase family 1 protein [Ardenticatenaceae bacterium]|nr:glycosyltransferase family 1 protein [Ardenticatenaceae bacterium]
MHLAINAFFWNQPHTGSGQYTRQLVYHLNRLVSDLDITLVFPRTAGEPAAEAVPPSVKVHEVGLRPGYVGKVVFEQIHFPRACRDVGAGIALVPYFGSPLRSPVPVVVTIHDLITMIFRDYYRSAGARLYNGLVAAAAQGANHVLTDSDASRKDIIERLNISPDLVTRVYLAPSPDFKPEGDFLLDMAVKQKYDLPDFYTLYLGGFNLHKNVTTLLLAYTYVAQGVGSQYPLLLAGKKPTQTAHHIPDYDGYIKKLGIEKNVRWLGYVDEADKPIIYREAMSFVFPSRYEGFGLPPLEAMASNVPVVTTDAPGINEVVGNAAMTVDPDDERQMGGAIIATLIQDNLANELREKGLARVKEFSWEKTVGETVGVLAEV